MGRRHHVMPGARMVWIVTMKFRPVRIELNPVMKIPMTAADTCELE